MNTEAVLNIITVVGRIREEQVDDCLEAGEHDHEGGCNNSDIEFDHDDEVGGYDEP